MSGEDKLKEFAAHNFQKTVTKINHRIYHFLGYGHSNAIAIIGNTSVILVDTLDSDEYGRDLMQEIRRITDKPVRTIIFSHGHPDHRGGSGAFRDTAEEVIAFAPQKPALKYYDRLEHVLAKRGKFQHGYGLTDEEAVCQGIGIREGKETGHGKYDFLSPTTVYNQKSVDRTIDGVKMKLVSAVGETDDQILIWLEEDQVICTGDNYYGCWPNLYAIRGTQYRDIAAWIDTLDEILTYPAVALLPGHTKPLIGQDMIKDQVGTFRDAIEYVLMQTLDCMDRGLSMSETVEAVKLPEKYAEKEYLGEFYGTVEWAVRSIYSGYLGWFDGNPANLLPVSEREYRAALLDVIDHDRLRTLIAQSLDQEQYQLALQLLELTDDRESRKRALLGRASQVTSANARHYLIASSKI